MGCVYRLGPFWVFLSRDACGAIKIYDRNS